MNQIKSDPLNMTIQSYDWMDEDELMIIGKHQCVLLNLKTGLISQMTTEMITRLLAEREAQETEDAASTERP